MSCVYTSTRSPLDEEYLDIARQATIVQEIETLNNQMKDMETQINHIKSNNSIVTSPNSSVPSLLTDDMTVSSFEDTNSVACIASLSNEVVSLFRPKKRTKLIASVRNDINAFLTTDTEEEENASKAKPWTLTFQKGDICINTHVTTHSDLLDNLFHMMGAVELMPSIPATFTTTLEQNTILGVLNVKIRRKYGKTHCRSVAKSVRIFVTPDLSTINTMVVAQSPDSIQTTTNKLLRAYLRCQHLQQLAIHAGTFHRLFISNSNNLEESPAAMALCAAICTFRCKHVAECLPSISLVEYGKFYFDRARDLLADLFDQIDLETFTSYTFMAVYKLTISQIDEALFYADMAERISLVLDPHYTHIIKQPNQYTMEEQGEAVHYKRLQNHLHRVLTFEEISRSGPTEELQVKSNDLTFCTLLKMGEGTWEIAKDDSIQEKWFAQMHGYILQLQRGAHEASKHAQSCDLQELVGMLGHQVEMSMRHWYRHILPPEFKLTIPLFDSTMDSKELYQILERECAHSAIPVLTTLALYDEWMVVVLTYLPKSIPGEENDWFRIHEVWAGGSRPITQANEKWNRRINKLLDMRKQIEFEGTDQEFFAAVNNMLRPVEARVNSPILQLGLSAAFNTVQLLHYLRSRSQDCHFDIRTMLNAWQLLLVVSKLQPIMPPKVMELMPRVHKSLTECMTMVKEELKLQPYQGKVGDYFDVMERDLKSQVIQDDDDDCDCVACPNA